MDSPWTQILIHWKALVFFWPPIKSFQRPDPQFHRRPARIVKKLISGNFARSEKWMENINAFEVSEDSFGNIWKFCTLWKIFRNIWKLYTLWKKSAGNIGGNNPNPALNMFVKIKLFYTLPLYHWIHIKTKKYAYLLISRYHLKGIRNYFHSSSMVDSSVINFLVWCMFLVADIR